MDVSCATARKEKEEREYISMRMRRWAKESWNPNKDKKDVYTHRSWKTDELKLTGPTRAVVPDYDPGSFEVVLKVKGATESADRDLSFLVLPLKERYQYHRYYTSKYSTLELTLRRVDCSVEATISMRLAAGSSWPRGFQGVFTASIASIDDAEVSLLSFEDDKLLVIADDGIIKLTRRIVSVEREHGELKVSATAWCANDEQDAMTNDIVFTPRFAGRSCGVLNVGRCKIQITVAWSLFDS
uniref:DUF6598 domain-containing protein n=1 Tax=Triticum aestivum TaxID=4565 RepID=A0A077RVQ9_WHEAT|nr:unnamed protein product [Triticum aestivum]